jgi:hypothetical protein
MWQIGNGKKVRFWEDHWFGTCSLAIQFWKIYVIVNEKGLTSSLHLEEQLIEK